MKSSFFPPLFVMIVFQLLTLVHCWFSFSFQFSRLGFFFLIGSVFSFLILLCLLNPPC